MVTNIRLDQLRIDTDHCPMGVTRKGEYEPCDRPAIAAFTHWWEGEWFTDPICAYHAHMNGKYGTLVPLSLLLSVREASDG